MHFVFLLLLGSLLTPIQSPLEANGYDLPLPASTLSPVYSIQAQAYREQPSVSPGQSFWMGVELNLPPHLHVGYALPLGDWPSTHVQLRLPKALAVRQMLWPTPRVDLSGSKPQIYYEDKATLLIEIAWRASAPGKSIELPLMEGQLIVDGQARWAGQSHLFDFNRVVILPMVRLPNEVPYPQDPLAVSSFRRARHQIPDRVDPSQVDWSAKGNNLQIQISGMMLSTSTRWLAAAYRVRSDIVDPAPTSVVLLEHTRQGDRDIFAVPREKFREWLKAGVEQVLLINESGDQSLIIAFEEEVLSLSLVEQLSTWCQEVFDQISSRLRT